VRWGFIPGGGSHVRLPRQIPWAIAMQLVLTGDSITAQRAFDVGLVNELVTDGEALTRASEIAHRIARNSPVAVRTAKEIMIEAAALGDGFEVESALNTRVLQSDDAREGVRAFADRRRPDFPGR
jgi:enoyl-CoA hydratase/carnithine racemase